MVLAIDAWALGQSTHLMMAALSSLTWLLGPVGDADLQTCCVPCHAAGFCQCVRLTGVNDQSDLHGALQAWGRQAQMGVVTLVGRDPGNIGHEHAHLSEEWLQEDGSQGSDWPIYWGSIGVTRQAQGAGH